jgi:hypothetical protein
MMKIKFLVKNSVFKFYFAGIILVCSTPLRENGRIRIRIHASDNESGSGRPKNMWIRILNAANNFSGEKYFQQICCNFILLLKNLKYAWSFTKHWLKLLEFVAVTIRKSFSR